MDKTFITWNQVNKLLDKIHDQTQGGFDYVSGIPRGGLILAVLYSHRFGVEFMEYPSNHYHNLLILDDIADSGETLDKWKNYQTAVLHYKPHTSKTTPTIWAVQHETGDWIVYPWEHPQAKTIQDYKLEEWI